jgi:hypothetical protein
MLGIHVECAVSSASRLYRRSIQAMPDTGPEIEDKKKMMSRGGGTLEPS